MAACWVGLLGYAVLWTTFQAELESEEAQALTILDTGSYWRCHFTWKTPVVRLETGLEEVQFRPDLIKCNTPLPPPDWKEADFDDRSWARLPGPFFAENSSGGFMRGEGTSPALSLLCLRGKFEVRGPAKTENLTLSLEYRGGVVVYLNGKEVVRKHLPEGEITLATLADDYPTEAFVRPDGKVIRWGFGDPENYRDRLALRIRQLEDVVIPSSMLTKGVNVLAIEVHRSPYDQVVMRQAKDKELFYGGGSTRAGGQMASSWGTVALTSIELQAAGEAVVANTSRPKGFQAWNINPLASVFDVDYGDPNETLAPIEIIATQNGAFSGQMVVSCDQPIQGLRVKVSDLKLVGGRDRILTSAIQVRYVQPGPDREDGAERRYPGLERGEPRRFDALLEAAPEKVPLWVKKTERGVPGPTFGAVQPIWVTVNVPADATPASYEGKLTIRAEGHKNVDVPVKLKVYGWKLPNPEDWATFVDVIQSPESVALEYKVPLWSDQHFELMEKSFELMGKLGTKTVYLPLICRTNLGNSESMVRWIKQADGSFKYDFTVFDRYLDLVLKHLKKPKVICLYLWENYTGSGSSYGSQKKWHKDVPHWDTVLVSLLDPATGKVTEMEGPGYDRLAQAEAFWKPVLEAAREHLAQRGLLDAMMLGLVWDVGPSPEAVAMLHRILPDAKWVKHAHGAGDRLFGVPIGYVATVWSGPNTVDPEIRRQHGWKTAQMIVQFDRTYPYISPLKFYRLLAEWNLAGRHRGIGRKGADFWPVLERRRQYPVSGRLSSGRYLQSDRSNRNIYQPDWLAPGPQGAVSTIRFEMAREGIQECEARIFLDKALTDEELRDKLSEGLARRAQAVLDQRTRFLIYSRLSSYVSSLWYPASGWQERSAKLYALAAEAAEAVGQR